jgi:hypothetical protein
MKNETFAFEAVPAHPGPVDITALLTEIEGVIKKHVVLKDEAAAALAVWVLHTYTFELRDAVAYVAVESPEKRCGKTTLISVLAAMAHKPLIASNISVGALFRAIDVCRPTLFIDEADTFLAGNGTMRGIINSGNTWRTAYVLRLSRGKRAAVKGVAEGTEGTQGTEANETGLKRYSCWCPKVIALIGAVADTIADRSIVVKMTRKMTTEVCAPLTDLNTMEIRSKCRRFALDAAETIRRGGKIRGEGLNDRAADTFDPLYVIARLAGADWEKKLHAAALGLSNAAQSDSASVELLLDVLAILLHAGGEKMFSRDLVRGLREGTGGTRSLALKDSEIDEFGISKILKGYGIRPTTMRIGHEVNRGYHLTDFREALNRYVPRDAAEEVFKEENRRRELGVEAWEEFKKQQEERKRALEEEIKRSAA